MESGNSHLGIGIALGVAIGAALGVAMDNLAVGMGAGIASPATLTQAISVNPHAIGSASGLYGFAQMAVGALCTAIAGLGNDPALSAGLVLAVAATVGQIAFRVAIRQART